MTRRAELVQVIRTVHVAGTGTYEDPFWEAVRLWTLDGTLIAEVDPTATPGDDSDPREATP